MALIISLLKYHIFVKISLYFNLILLYLLGIYSLSDILIYKIHRNFPYFFNFADDMSSPNAKLLLLLMLPFSLKMFPFLEFMTGVWSFAAFLTAWIIERLMEFSLLRILPFFAFQGTGLLQIYPRFVIWRFKVFLC